MTITQVVLAMALVAAIVLLLEFMGRHAHDDFHELGTFIRLGLLVWAYRLNPWVSEIKQGAPCNACRVRSSIHFEGERRQPLSLAEIETIHSLIRIGSPETVFTGGPEWRNSYGVCFTPKDMSPGRHVTVLIRQDQGERQ